MGQWMFDLAGFRRVVRKKYRKAVVRSESRHLYICIVVILTTIETNGAYDDLKEIFNQFNPGMIYRLFVYARETLNSKPVLLNPR